MSTDDDEEPETDAPEVQPNRSPARPPTPQRLDTPRPAPAPRARPRRGHADRLPDGPPELAPGRRARGGAAGRGRRIRDPGPLGAIDFDADTGWREVIRELPRQQKEMASHDTVDELPAREAAACGNISKQIITHINRTADAEAIDLLALLPELLLTDRALTRNGTRRFLERCHQVVALRGLDDLLQRPDGRFRRRLASANDDERVQTDVLKLIRKAEYGRAGKALMRNEVARGTSSTFEALERLFPDQSEELRELQTSLEGEDLPEGVPLDREVFTVGNQSPMTSCGRSSRPMTTSTWLQAAPVWQLVLDALQDAHLHCVYPG